MLYKESQKDKKTGCSKRCPFLTGRRSNSERVLRVYEAIAKGNFPNASEIAHQLGSSVRSVMRDIRYLREFYDADIPFDWQKNGFHVVKPPPFSFITTPSEAQMFAMWAGKHAVAQYAGTPIEGAVSDAVSQVAVQCTNADRIKQLEYASVLSFRPFPREELGREKFDILSYAVRKKAIITFQYQDQHGNIAMRRAEAYHLAAADSRWYLLARNLAHGKIKTYAVRRISRLTPTGEHFTKPRNFDPHPYFASAFRATTGDKLHQIVIRLDKYATTVTTGVIHHPSQQLTHLEDGSSRITFQLSSLAEIEAWVLGWGPRAEVLQPQELRDRVRKNALGTLDIYALDGKLE